MSNSSALAVVTPFEARDEAAVDGGVDDFAERLRLVALDDRRDVYGLGAVGGVFQRDRLPANY